MRTLEKIGSGTFSPLGGEAAAVLGGAVAIPRYCIGGYTLIDGYLYPDYIEDWTVEPTTGPTTRPS